MSPRALRPVALAALTVLAAFLLTQLAIRANRAYEAVTAVRTDLRSVTVLFDRAAGTSVAHEGWGDPTLGQGVWSTKDAPILMLPTSTASGDVELTLVMGSGVRLRPVIVKAGDTNVGIRQAAAWTPKGAGDETVRIVVPRAWRDRPYQVRVTFDLAQPNGEIQPIRIVSASTHILRDR